MNKKPADKNAAFDNEMFSELDRIIERAKDENEALNNMLKNIAEKNEKKKNEVGANEEN